jgi:hypothetical protein
VYPQQSLAIVTVDEKKGVISARVTCLFNVTCNDSKAPVGDTATIKIKKEKYRTIIVIFCPIYLVLLFNFLGKSPVYHIEVTTLPILPLF